MAGRALDNRINEAIARHQAGEIDAAESIYREVLADDPDSVDALHFLGMLAFLKGEQRQGMDLVHRALELNPAYVDAHNNFGNMFVETGDLENARACYENALACNPDGLAALNNLGVLLRNIGDLEGSLQHLLRAVKLSPGWAHAHFSLGRSYAELGQREPATAHYLKSLELDPKLEVTRRIIANYLRVAGKPEIAHDIYVQWIEAEPENPVPQHMLAALGTTEVPLRASDGYIIRTFDDFAQSFEMQLERLGYRGPQIIADEIGRRYGSPRAELKILDLGCGTGLCGPLVKPFASALTGVDLSSGMLSRCARGGHYDQLVQQELVAFLQDESDHFDLMISADTLVYFGDLRAFVSSAAERLTTGGRLLFTVEQNVESDEPYILYHHGRYGHHSDYLQSELELAGLKVLLIGDCVLRRELGEPVRGWLISTQKIAES